MLHCSCHGARRLRCAWSTSAFALCNLAVFLFFASFATSWIAADQTDRAAKPGETDRAIDAWIRDLDGETFAIREAAQNALTRAGSASVAKVAAAAGSEKPETRNRAMRILASLYDADDAQTRRTAETALEKLASSDSKTATRPARNIFISREMKAFAALKGKVKVRRDDDGRVNELMITHDPDHRVKNDDLLHMAAFRKLTRLELTGRVVDDYVHWPSAVTDDGLKHLARLEHLQHLDLFGSLITDAGLKQIALVRSLKSLRLSDWRKKISGEGLNQLGSLHRLESLELVDFKSTVLVPLQDMPSLRKMSLVLPQLDIE